MPSLRVRNRCTSWGRAGRPAAAGYDADRATDPNWHPVDEEIAQVLAVDPGLAEELAEFDQRLRGWREAGLIPDDEVRRLLQASGLHLSPRLSDPEAGSTAS